jgi:CubicO group peptidase (beta-lactamase class C family)
MRFSVKIIVFFTLITFIFPLSGCMKSKTPPSETAIYSSHITQVDGEALSRFEAELEGIRQKLMIPGFSAAIVKDQELIWAKGFGYADLERQIKATPNTPYPIASLTKPFAATIIMQLEEEGVLNLNDPITKYGIDFESEGSIELWHVLSHTSQGKPGSEFAYNGDRFADLGYLIKNASDQSFRELLLERILIPLNMTDTAPNPISMGDGVHDVFGIWLDPNNSNVYRKIAKPYRLDSNYLTLEGGCPEFFTPAAGLNSTAIDLAKFDIALDQNILLDEDAKERMFKPTISNNGSKLPYGIGWFTQEYKDLTIVWHYGWQPSCSSAFILKIPEENITFILLANSDNLSRPYRLGSGEVLPIDSTIGLAFFKAFIFEPTNGLTVPNINWEADKTDLADQLMDISDPSVNKILQRELLSYRKLFHSVGRIDQTEKLTSVYTQVYGTSRSSSKNQNLFELGADPWLYVPLPRMREMMMIVVLILAALSIFIAWPIDYLVSRRRLRRQHPQKPVKSSQEGGRRARFLALMTIVLNLVVPVLFFSYLFNYPSFQGEVFLQWTGGVALAKILIVVTNISILLSLALAGFTIRVWKMKYWNIPWRVHYTIITMILLICGLVWQQLNLLGWIS